MTLVASVMLMLTAIGEPAVPSRALGSTFTKSQIKIVAAECKVGISFVDMPPSARKLFEADFAFNLDQHATDQQRACFDARVPRGRVGLISEPEKPKGKKE